LLVVVSVVVVGVVEVGVGEDVLEVVLGGGELGDLGVGVVVGELGGGSG